MEIMLILWLACGGFAAWVANDKSRSGCLWAILGILFGPIALITVGFLPPAEPPTSAEPVQRTNTGMLRRALRNRDEFIICPNCEARNPGDARYCRECQSSL